MVRSARGLANGARGVRFRAKPGKPEGMNWPRVQLFEFNDSPWAPEALREGIIDALSLTLERGRILQGLVEPFAAFLEQAGTDRVLDLGAGAGGPMRVLLGALGERGVRPRVTLTDLQPRPDAWAPIQAVFPHQVDYVGEPVDATRVPPHLAEGRARTIINVLHHFPPALVAQILADAVHSGESIFVAEGFGRAPSGFVAFAPAGIPTLLQVPLRGRHRLQKALLFWASPVGLAVSAWDGFVSTLRIHTEDELRALVAPFGQDYEWRFGWYPIAPFGRGYWFSGTPR